MKRRDIFGLMVAMPFVVYGAPSEHKPLTCAEVREMLKDEESVKYTDEEIFCYMNTNKNNALTLNNMY